MKTIRAVLCISALLTGAASAAEHSNAGCLIEGELVQWMADYCMLTLETDDEIIAGECIAKELEKNSKDQCKAKRHYKTAMCERVVARDGIGIVDECVSDTSFMGSTVRNGGVGAQ